MLEKKCNMWNVIEYEKNPCARIPNMEKSIKRTLFTFYKKKNGRFWYVG